MSRFNDTLQKLNEDIFKPASNEDKIARQIEYYKANELNTDAKPFSIDIQFTLTGIAEIKKYSDNLSSIYMHYDDKALDSDSNHAESDIESDIRVQIKKELQRQLGTDIDIKRGWLSNKSLYIPDNIRIEKKQ